MTQLVQVHRTGDDVTVGDRLPRLSVDVTPRTVVMGASATRDWQPQHHDHKHCVEVAGLPDIFLNTPHQAGIIQRYLTGWGGPHARLGRLAFRMKRSVVPGDRLDLDAEVTEVRPDGDVTWVTCEVALTVDDEVATTSTAQLALPTGPGDNPWSRTGADWRP
ncbi:MaoC/PaaZ C-terminal domain-containing protein [Nitriliruptor alkaliphilus]|uniref:MaoC/PaaZ C-terminal domain-containing protein n=1 Tax=Nitriliruptor alkaliphilus TaxID=427918 RepID=UPI001B800882|nr:MaoC/PaaZ C-terminal domain-containing protein [Nitriliruptor alkaliphilus]